MSDSVKGKITLYAAGGAGVNIGQTLEAFREAQEFFADIDVVYLDTSRSNFKNTIAEDKIYHIDGLDGSGGVRATNAKPIKEHLLNILRLHPAADLSIVLSSGGGGSGSVIAPLLMRELLAQKKHAIAIMVGSAASKKEAENTLNTLQSYEGIASKVGLPVPLMYFANSRETPRKEVDSQVRRAVVQLAMLFSRQNAELDSQDLYNWTNFTTKTTYPAMLASLTIYHQDEMNRMQHEPISVATLTLADTDHYLEFSPESHTVGIVSDEIEDETKTALPAHFVIGTGVFEGVGKTLKSALAVFAQQHAARLQRTSVLKSDQTDDDGLVL